MTGLSSLNALGWKSVEAFEPDGEYERRYGFSELGRGREAVTGPV